jgi:antirestriction protein ArdC
MLVDRNDSALSSDTYQQRELEAESTAFIVCARNGVECKSQSYLASCVKQDTTTEQLDLYQIMRAAGQVETILGLAAHAKLSRPAAASGEPAMSTVKTNDLFDKQHAAKSKMFGAMVKLATLLGKKVRDQIT